MPADERPVFVGQFTLRGGKFCGGFGPGLIVGGMSRLDRRTCHRHESACRTENETKFYLREQIKRRLLKHVFISTGLRRIPSLCVPAP